MLINTVPFFLFTSFVFGPIHPPNLSFMVRLIPTVSSPQGLALSWMIECNDRNWTLLLSLSICMALRKTLNPWMSFCSYKWQGLAIRPQEGFSQSWNPSGPTPLNLQLLQKTQKRAIPALCVYILPMIASPPNAITAEALPPYTCYEYALYMCCTVTGLLF